MSAPARAGDPSPETGALERELRRADTLRRWLLSAPALIIILLFAAGPLIVVLIYSFLTPGDYGNVKWIFSAEAWMNVVVQRDIFDGTLRLVDAHVAILWRSLSLSVLTTLLTLACGLPTAYFIATRPDSTRNFWLFLITVPFWSNLLVRTIAVQEVIRNEGVVNTLLITLGVIDAPLQLLFTDFAILFGMTYVYLPLMALPIYASIERLDFRLVEAGYDLYASRFTCFRRVILPLVKPGIIAGSILVFVPSLGQYVIPRILGGGRKLMLGNLIELQFGQGRNWPLGAALALTLLVFVVIALFYYTVATRRSARRHG